MSKILWSASIFIFLIATIFYNFFDIEVAKYFHALKDNQVNDIFHDITQAGRSEFYLIPSLGLYYYYKNRDFVRSQKAMFMFSSVAVSGIMVLIIKVILGRFRPEMFFKNGDYGFDFFEINQRMLSFPSGHSATAMSVAFVLGLLYRPYRYLFFFLGLLVVVSRVIVVRHYPSDVLVGALIGVVSVILLYEKYYKDKIEVNR